MVFVLFIINSISSMPMMVMTMMMKTITIGVRMPVILIQNVTEEKKKPNN